ncbi:hypothetical protein SDC9_205670 [bioreactor metagenome]|uniref:Uncharacterized protein n=1 Tax=bioreactor metagenome TaxID=1076179 RepID=A0A645JC59_9ZZZZ
MCAQALRRGVRGIQRTQRAQPAQAVQQEGVHMAQLHHLLLAGRARTPAHNRHEQGNQRRGAQQDQRRHP